MDTVWSLYVSVGKQKVGVDDFIVFKCETEVHLPTQRAPCVLVSFYRLSSRLGHPIRQQRMLRSLGIELWINPAVDRVARLLTSQLATRLGMVRILFFSEQVMIVVLDAAMMRQEG